MNELLTVNPNCLNSKNIRKNLSNVEGRGAITNFLTTNFLATFSQPLVPKLIFETFCVGFSLINKNMYKIIRFHAEYN